jgi:hypothetical protein
VHLSEEPRVDLRNLRALTVAAPRRIEDAPVRKVRWATLVLMAGGALALLILGRYLLGDEATGRWDVVGVRTAVFGGLAVCLFVSVRARPAIKTAMATLCLIAIGGLYVADLVLAGSDPGDGRMPLWAIDLASPAHKAEVSKIAAQSGVKVDTRDRSAILDDLRAQHIDAVPAVMLADVLQPAGAGRSGDPNDPDRVLPLGGISRALTVLCNQSGSYVTYQSDEHGFRNPPGLWDVVHLDLAVVGQSLTQGYCMADGNGFVDLLRASHPLTLNLGVSGQSSILQLAAIREYLPRYTPKAVLWIFAEGIDLPDVLDESRDPIAVRYLETTFTQHVAARQAEIDIALRNSVSRKEARTMHDPTSAVVAPSFVGRVLPFLKLWHLRETMDLAYGITLANAQPEGQQTALRLLQTALGQAHTLTSSWGGTIYFVYLPSWARYRNSAHGPEDERTSVLKVVHDLGIPIIDTEPAFRAQKDPLSLFPLRRFGHYNERGNRLVAETIRNALSGRAHHHDTVE